MMDVKNLLKKLEGKSPEEQAKIVSNFYSDKKRKQTTEEARKATRDMIFAGLKKLTKAQQESYLYEFIAKNDTYIANWMQKNHPELKTDNKTDNVSNS